MTSNLPQMRRREAVQALSALSALGCGGFMAAQGARAEEAWITSHPGELPLILTVPHDGDRSIFGVARRDQGTFVRDTLTQNLAQRTVEQLHQRTGKRPYLVMFNVARPFVDVNRAAEEAFESPKAEPAYRMYHDTVARHVAELKARFPRGALLVDVHGQGAEAQTTFRGTRAGLTVKALRAQHGAMAVAGPQSLMGELDARGYRVFPATHADASAQAIDLREDPRFAGGYTVATYGSHQTTGIDAIQIEFGRGHRADFEMPKHLADSLLAFLRRFGYLA